MQIIQHTKYLLQHYQLAHKSFLLAVSGGRDSMALAYLFFALKLNFTVAHINYGFRAEDSDKDESLVKEWCEANGIPFYCLRKNGKEELNGKNLQDYARNVRYSFFYKTIKEHNIDMIATAHHQDDQAETLLLQLFRGAGLNGLQGMKVIENNIFRPFLDYNRSVINHFIKENNIPYREDATNAANIYNRNFIRNELFPQLENTFPDVKRHIAQAANRLQEANYFYQKSIQKSLHKLLKNKTENGFLIPINLLLKSESTATLIYELLAHFHLSARYIFEIKKLLSAKQGARLQIENYQLLKDRNNIWWTKQNEATDYWLIEKEDFKNGTIHLENANITFQINEQSKKYTNSSVLYLDYNKISFPLIVRKTKAGDYFYPFGLNKKKKVAKFLIDEKVPLNKRAHKLVLQSGHKIIAVIGHRIDHRYRITTTTTSVLAIEYSK